MAQYKNKRKRKLSKKRLLDKQTKPKAGDITKYIQQYDPKNKRHQQYFFQIVTRVSTEGQRNHLQAQLERIRCWADVFNLSDRLIPSDFKVVASLLQLGNEKKILKIMDKEGLLKSRYGWLADIAGRVWPLQFDLPDMKFALLFESSCRAVRPDDWSPENQDAPITKDKLEEFAEASLHLPIFTIYPLDDCSAEIVRYRTKFDLLLKERKELLGINYKPKVDRLNRVKSKPEVIRLHFEKDLSYQQIFEKLEGKVELSTIEYWCQTYQKER